MYARLRHNGRSYARFAAYGDFATELLAEIGLTDYHGMQDFALSLL